MNEKTGMLPSCWGPFFWGVLHSIAYVYNPSTDSQKYFDFFANLGYILPCEECKLHYFQNVNKQELLLALETNESFFRWVYDLHNKVNSQTGVPESKWPSYELVKQRYSSFKANCSEIPGVCGSNGSNKKKIKMVEQFGNITEDQLPFLISTVILGILLFIAICYIIKKSYR